MDKKRVARAGVVAAVAAIVLVTALAAAPVWAVAPTRPEFADVYVSAADTVYLEWQASIDASGHPITYDIYRDVVPLTADKILSRALSPVKSVTTTSTTVTAAANEAEESYVYYYAVVARDSLGATSAPSVSWAPNIHGSTRSMPGGDTYEIETCQRCHDPHGVLDYRAMATCYVCHGGTSAGAAQGAKSTYNTQRYFYDYDGQTAGSQHRNAYMAANKTECALCHTSHRSPYYYDPETGAYVASKSYTDFLRVKTGATTYTYYTQHTSQQKNGFCFACHGTNTANIGRQGGPDAYTASGGDHNQTNYETAAAHGSSVIYANPDANPNGAQVQCLACHNKHASATLKLIDYRQSDTTTQTYAGAGICYACHSSASTEASVAAGYSAPFAWNDRDVKAEFQRTSHHPTTTTGGYYQATHHATWSDTTKAEFDTYVLTQTQTTDTAGGEIVLDQYTTTIDPPAEPWVYGNRGDSISFDGYDIGSATWNDGFDPDSHDGAGGNSNFSPREGSSSVWVNGKVYTTAGNASTAQYEFDPTNGTGGDWNTAQTLPNSIDDGGDTALNTSDQCIYYSRGGSQTRIMWWTYNNTTTGGFNFQTSGIDRQLGIGSSIAYAPTANRLFVIYQNGTAGDGRLYYRNNPGTSTMDANFVQGPSVTSDSSTRYARMAYFTKSGTEYLMIVGRDTGDTPDTIIISGLGAASPTVLNLNTDPFGADLAAGCDLEWDGGEYIYVVRGGSNTGFRRIRIPDDPTSSASWTAAGLWSSELASPPWGTTWNRGASIVVGTYDPPSATGQAYYASGTALSTEITPYGSAHSWGEVSWTENEAANTDFTVTVEGYSGSWSTLVSGRDDSPIDLSAYSTSTYTKIRLTGNFSTSDALNTSTLYDWAVTSIYDQWLTTGSVTCVSCHNVHYVKEESASGVWDADRASDPDNTKLTVASTTYGSTAADLCMRCHDGTPPESTMTASAIVPYDVSFSAVSGPYFFGWNKAASGYSFANSGHLAATVANGRALCENCHDPHASSFQRLTAWTKPAGITAGAGTIDDGNRENTSTTLSREENLCYRCHGNGTNGDRATGAKDVATKIAIAGSNNKHQPADDTDVHRDTESAEDLGTSRHAECTDCHDPHVAKRVSGSAIHTSDSSVGGGAIYGVYGAVPNYETSNWSDVSSFDTTRLAGGTFDYEAYLCFKCHGSNVGSGNIPSDQTDIPKEFNPSNQSYHNVLGQSVGMQTAFTVVSGGTTYTVTWALPTASRTFQTGYSYNTMLTCTSCHTNPNDSGTQAAGPHGSSVEWLIDPNYPRAYADTKLGNDSDPAPGFHSDSICAKCHRLTDGSTWGNYVHEKHARGYSNTSRQGNGCTTCHCNIPHGWKRPRLIGYRTDPAPYATDSYGYTSFMVRSYTNVGSDASWDVSYCGGSGTGCGKHSGTASPVWP